MSDTATPKGKPADKMVKIIKIDHRGNGKSFRFFTVNPAGVVLTCKIDDDVANYHEGMEVLASKLSLLEKADAKQIARFNSAKSGSIDTSLIA